MRLSVSFKFLCLALGVFALFAQKTGKGSFEYRRGQQLYNQRQYQKAEPFAKKAYEANTRHQSYFTLYKNVLVRLNKKTDAINVIKFRIQQYPKQVSLKIELAGLYFDLNQKDAAYAAWDSALASPSANMNDFVQVSNEMVRRRLVERAIAVYKKAQTRFKNKTMFLTNIARLQEFAFKYTDAFESYLAFLASNKRNLRYVRQQLIRLMEKEDAKAVIVEKAENLSPSSPEETQLKADILLVDGNYTAALSVLLKLKNPSTPLLNFAREVGKLGQFSYAEKAYRAAEPFAPEASLSGLLRARISALETLAKDSAKTRYAGVDTIYNAYTAKFKNTGTQLEYARHLLLFRGDGKTAKAVLGQISKRNLRANDSNLLLYLQGVSAFLAEDFAASKQQFAKVKAGFRDDEKYLYLTAMDLIEGDYTSVHLNDLIKSKTGLKSRNLNDALRILIDMTGLASKTESKKAYATSFYQFLLGDVTAAVNSLNALIKTDTSYAVSGNRFKFEMLMHGKAWQAAGELARKLELAGENSDEWLYKKILTLKARGEDEQVQAEIKRLILAFPQSFWTIEARLLVPSRESS